MAYFIRGSEPSVSGSETLDESGHKSFRAKCLRHCRNKLGFSYHEPFDLTVSLFDFKVNTHTHVTR